MKPSTPIQYLKGVGPHLAKVFEKKSVYTAWDLLFYLPIKYLDRRKIFALRDLPVGQKQSFVAEVVDYKVRPLHRRRGRLLEIILKDDSGVAKASFFQFKESYLKKKFPIGSQVLFYGDVRLYSGVKSIVHPEMELWEDDVDDGSKEAHSKIYPCYSLTEGLYQKTVRRIFQKNLDDLLETVQDEPLSVRDNGKVTISLKEAFRHIHNPPLEADVEALNEQKDPYHQRIIYDEFFYLQLGLVSKRYKQSQQKNFCIVNEQNLVKTALQYIPFELTDDQKQALEDVKNDFSSTKPMNRMLQGDVGSGKTMVAFLSSLLAIESGYQVALMAPTEILAEQHFKNLFPFEDRLGIRIELLMGSTKAKKREQILYDLEQGLTKLIIGTHALITPDVKFYKLGYVVIDEQHRFGVMQRAQLKNKSKFSDSESSPHLLVMTATPIPRTLSMCAYGDLDLSIIQQKPKGRKPIMTKVFREKARPKMYDLIRTKLKKGEQVYFVYPLVEESEKLDLKNATEMHKNLSKEFCSYQVGLIHGKMKAVEKEQVMQRFKDGAIHILVSTTVVEVGVDVPNSTIMVIEHAERFGLSQLHQLRGRVGRGDAKSYCYLMAGYAASQESQFRLKVMEQTDDGFQIAEEDLKLRGPGEFLGTKQSGMPDFRLAQIVRDGHLLSVAKKRAEEILQKDPRLEDLQHQELKSIMLERWGKRLDLTLV